MKHIKEHHHVGHPQSVFEALIKDGEIEPRRALDIGCGRGDNAIMLAMNGVTSQVYTLLKMPSLTQRQR